MAYMLIFLLKKNVSRLLHSKIPSSYVKGKIAQVKFGISFSNNSANFQRQQQKKQQFL